MIQNHLEEYLSRWNLILEETPLQTSTSLIAKVKWNNQHYVLKIAQDKGDERTASVLNHYDGTGAVKLILSEDHASLLERAIPGISLSELIFKGKDEQATQILCEVIQKLHSNKMFSGTYSSLEDLGKGFQDYFKSGDKQIPSDLTKEAEFIYYTLVKTQGRPTLLHGDLHQGNILYDEQRGWLAIDPKGYVGETAYEVGAFLRNPLNDHDLYEDPNQLHRRLDIICENLGFNRDRVLAWAFSQTVLAGIWCVEDGKSPERMVTLAKIFKKSHDRQVP